MKLPIKNAQLKEFLIKEKLITEGDWTTALRNANRRRRSIGEVLIERGFFSEKFLYEFVAAKLKVEYINLKTLKLDEKIVELIPEEVAQEMRCIAFGQNPKNKKLQVACLDPSNKEIREAILKLLGPEVDFYLSSDVGFRFASRLYNTDVKEELLSIINEHVQQTQGKSAKNLDLPVVKIFDILLQYALLEQASDVHIEPLPDAVLVRFRVDGELQDKIELPLAIRDSLVARIKILANLKIDEHRIPQDGRIGFTVDEAEESARVSIIPTLYGEKAVLRMMSEEMQNITLQDIGFADKNLESLMRQVKKPFGMVLVVGPTGSGKTTSLYAVLNILNTENVNIATIEDPIEYGIRRISQTQVNTTAGYSFASGLRALLRQDPDVIMIGEIRDGKTAQIATRAALTGHLVLSTLHTNNASGAPPRLLDMDVEPFLVASTLNLVIAQRLVRRICRECIASYKLSAGEIRSLSKEFDLGEVLTRMHKLGVVDSSVSKFSSLNFYKGKGCEQCHSTGYTGRVAVMEVLENTHAVQQAIIKRMSSDDMEAIAKEEGMITIFEDAMQKSLLGLTSLEEMLRIVKD